MFANNCLLMLLASTGLNVLAAGSTQTRHFTTSDGVRYVYDYEPAKVNKSTVLLLHGFPATRRDWHHQVDNLTAAGYGVIAPDLLGYGDTDRPIELEAYKLKRTTGHLIEILDSHSLQKVIGIGHDWGTVTLSRALAWHSNRFQKVAFLSAGYAPAGELFDVDAINAASYQNYGYMQYGYWYFFNSYDAGDVIEKRVSIQSV